MVRRLLPPFVIGFVAFGVIFLAICLKLNILFFGCAANCPRWYLNAPKIVQCLPWLCLPGFVAAVAGPFLFGDSDAMLYVNLFVGQTLAYWLAGHAANWLFHRMRDGSSPPGSIPRDP
jgi:hypothetical protein